MFLSLLYKALKADVNGKRTAAMCKRALQARARRARCTPGDGWPRRGLPNRGCVARARSSANCGVVVVMRLRGCGGGRGERG